MKKPDSSRVRRRRSALGATAMATLLWCTGAVSQTPALANALTSGYAKAGRVTIVVPFAPGGATDIIARLLADEVGKRWGTAVAADNKAGARGGIGTEFVARAAPGGYTLLLGTQTALAVNPSLLKKLGYNVEKDFAPITLLAQTPLVLLASTKSDANNVQELVARIKASPDAVSYVTSDIGTSQHLTPLMMLSQLGASAVHVRLPARSINDWPWSGLLAQAGTPAPAASFLNTEVVAVLNDPEVTKRLAAPGFTPKPMSQEAFARFIQTETAKFAQLIKSNKLVVE